MMPSGFSITIREQSGEDEDKLSRLGDAKTSDNLQNFLSGIIVGNDDAEHVDAAGKHKDTYTPSDIAAWKVNDKYYAVLKSRLFSLGKEVKFNYIFKDEPLPSSLPDGYLFTEDLTIFDADLANYKAIKDTLPATAIMPYPLGKAMSREFQLTSKKEVKYNLLSSYGEKRMLDKSENDLSINDSLRIRELQWKQANGQWMPVENFRDFKSSEMQELRADIKKHDPQFSMRSTVTSPKTGNKETFPIITLQDFFYPVTQL